MLAVMFGKTIDNELCKSHVECLSNIRDGV